MLVIVNLFSFNDSVMRPRSHVWLSGSSPDGTYAAFSCTMKSSRCSTTRRSPQRTKVSTSGTSTPALKSRWRSCHASAGARGCATRSTDSCRGCSECASGCTRYPGVDTTRQGHPAAAHPLRPARGHDIRGPDSSGCERRTGECSTGLCRVLSSPHSSRRRTTSAPPST